MITLEQKKGEKWNAIEMIIKKITYFFVLSLSFSIYMKCKSLILVNYQSVLQNEIFLCKSKFNDQPVYQSINYQFNQMISSSAKNHSLNQSINPLINQSTN